MTALPFDPTYNAIDLADSLDAIRHKYGDRYFANVDVMWEAAALWGITPDSGLINQAGVFTSATVALAVAVGRCNAEGRFAQAPNGYWAMSTNYTTPTSGYGYAPSVWSRVAFPSLDDARLAAVYELLGRLERECPGADRGSTGPDSPDLRALITKLGTQKRPQLSLF